jgi:biopolymer transport protein ExbB
MTFITKTWIIFALLSVTLMADELSDAYTKEYTFLKAQKNELSVRVKKEEASQNSEIIKAKNEVEQLQNKYILLTKSLDSVNFDIEKAKEMLGDKTSNLEIVTSVGVQAKMTLQEYGIILDEAQHGELNQIEKAFDHAATLYATLSSIQKTKGEFYLMNGTRAQGDIVKIGNIAAYGLSAKTSGALAPAGGGAYKLWSKSGSELTAKSIYGGTIPNQLEIFIYENLEKDIEYQKEKTIEDTIKAGGVIGIAILALGSLGLLLIILRILFLMKAGSNVEKITAVVSQTLERENSSQKALEAITNFQGSSARVIKATLRNIKKERDHIEDIVMESILNESSQLDRFGSFVLVIAAVAPLLGLLGTVTGMIATFDIITTHGTGDPKLLSGGISEALVTTMLGLVVAIPLLLLGNLMSGWANSIKDSMEQSALHVVNLYEKYRTR